MTKPASSHMRLKDAITQIQKRNGSTVTFELERISNAVLKAMQESAEGAASEAEFVARSVLSRLMTIKKLDKKFVPTVEAVQDLVEQTLIKEGYGLTAKHYILYRDERNRNRKEEVPDEIKKLVAESKQYFKNPLAEFIYFRSYSRWIDTENRRETWVETVNRYMTFMKENLGDKLNAMEYAEITQYIREMKTMPSMRLMWGAGPAARASNVVAFNCAFIAPSKFRHFGEILNVLCCGTGVGFAVESRNVQQLPIIEYQRRTRKDIPIYVVKDSKEGWSDALVQGMETWYAGKDVTYDFSQVRPAGARLKTMGGHSSGPEPLRSLLAFTRELILKRQGRRLSNLDVHDIVCKIGDVVVSGGVRRSALISLSDLDDNEMRESKQGHFFISHGHRSMANNSAVYNVKPTNEEFLEEWLALVKSHSGERGIFNREGLTKQIPARRYKLWEEMGVISDDKLVGQIGTNPCGEINLLSMQFCNLTEVVCRHEDTVETLMNKVRIGAILGTYQSTLMNFPYLSPEWKDNCERERLLGVSLTGQWDCPAVRNKQTLASLKEHAVAVNKEYAERFGIPQSTAVTAVKPSGTVSQLVDAASGGHTRYAPYYIRRVRIASHDPLFLMLKDQGLTYYPEVGQTMDTANTFVLEFPVKAPEGSKFSRDLSAEEQLNYWKMVKENYTEHNPSVTISVSDHEWINTAHWIWKNWDKVGGLSFLPREDMVYRLAPFEEITEEKYNEMLKAFANIDYSQIVVYEKEDHTQGAKELACVSGVCEI